MDIHKTYRNQKLELRRQQLIATAKADAVLHRAKKHAVRDALAVRRALRGQACGTVGQAVLSWLQRTPRSGQSTAFRRLLIAVAEHSSLLATEPAETVATLHEMALRFESWLREPETWRPGSHNAQRQLSSLLRHLFAHYRLPTFFDAAWSEARSRCHQDWFIRIGQGGNLRKAEDLPIPLTRMMAHHVLQAPPDSSIEQALRFGQARALGVSERLMPAMLNSRIGRTFYPAVEEKFWQTFLHWLAQHPMMDPAQIGPIVDFLHHQRFVPAEPLLVGRELVPQPPPQPNLTMKHRDPNALLAQTNAWHRRLRRSSSRISGAWARSPIDEYLREEGDGPKYRRFTIVELLSSQELRAEGAAMHHCVATYASSCLARRSAIFSMQVKTCQGSERLATIEIDLRHRQIVQVRRRNNAPPTSTDQRILNGWATIARLRIGRHAFLR